MAEDKKFHMVRVRAPGSAPWFDPELDFRKLFPEILKRSISLMEDMYEGKDGYDAVLFLHNCFEIFQLRLLEDKTKLSSQVDEFFKALVSVPANIRLEWISLAMSSLLCVYGLFCRRDSAADRKTLKDMLDYADASALGNFIRPETRAVLHNDISEFVDSLLVSSKTSDGGSVVCAETGEELEHVKFIARSYLGCGADKDWNELADMCDAAFSIPDNQRKEQVGLALCLAYPTYRHPTLMAEVTRGSGDEAVPAEDTGGHSPVQVDSREAANRK